MNDGNKLVHEADRLRRSREAAEALFRPKVALAAAVPQPAPVISEPDNRLTRFLPALDRKTIAAETPSGFKSKDEPNIVRDGISRSEHNRIRVLANYGMTIHQVAGLYGVAPETIEKIVMRTKVASSPKRSR